MESLWQSAVALMPESERWRFVIGTVFIHESLFIGLNTALFLLDYTGWAEKWRIQKDKYPSGKLLKACLIDLAINHLIVQWIALYYLWPVFEHFGMSSTAPLPSWSRIGRDLFICLVFNDTAFYWAHRALHSHPTVYKMIHKKHHKFTSVVGIASEYAHPVEQVLANQIPTIGGAMLLGCHMFTFWLWLAIRIIETIDAHSGFSFPLSPFHQLPGQLGAERHDYHHSHNKGNFGSFTVFWDKLCGTDMSFHEYKATQAAKEDSGSEAESESNSGKKGSERVVVGRPTSGLIKRNK